MTEKQLKDKAIKIQGKDYVLVSDRINYFNEHYTEGSIRTELLTDPLSDRIVIKAIVSPDGKREFIGHAQETVGQGFINKTSALENAETSAVGRALAFMGIGVIDSIASVDEMKKAGVKTETPTPTTQPQNAIGLLKVKLAKLGANNDEEACGLVADHSGVMIKTMQGLTERQAKEILELFVEKIN